MNKLVGFKVLNGISKKTGKQNDAVIFHCMNDAPRDESFVGQEVVSQYTQGVIARAYAKAVTGSAIDYNGCLGKGVKFVYNKDGFLEDVLYIKA